MNKKQKALASIITCVLFWGFSFISTKIAVVVFPPMSLGLIRFAIALVFLYFIKLKIAPKEKLRLRDVPLLFTAGLTGVTLYFFFENNGISLVSASEASIAISSVPALAMITDLISRKFSGFRKNRINNPSARIKKVNTDKGQSNENSETVNQHPNVNVRQWIGCFVSIAGVWLVAGVSFAISGNILGYFYMTGAAFSWVAYSFLTRPLFAHCSRIYIVFWQSVAGFIFFIPFSVMEFKSWGTADTEVIIHILFLGILCSALGYWFYVRALETLGVSVCAIFINLIPVVTVIAGFFMLGDRLTLLQWLGAVLVLSGVYITILEGKRKKSISAEQTDIKVL